MSMTAVQRIIAIHIQVRATRLRSGYRNSSRGYGDNSTGRDKMVDEQGENKVGGSCALCAGA